MNWYCQKEMDQLILASENEQQNSTKTDCIVPIISIRRMYQDYNILCNSWKFNLQTEVQTRGRIKRFIKKIIFKTVSWLFSDAVQNQTRFNLSVLHLMDDILKEMNYQNKKISISTEYPLLYICCDPIRQESNMETLLASIQYYSLHYHCNIFLLFICSKIDDNQYFEFLKGIIQEFKMRNVQFVITNDQMIIEDYFEKAFAQVSFNEKNNFYNQSLWVLQYSKTRRNYASKEIIFDNLELSGIAQIMSGMEKYHEKNTCD